MSSTVLIVGAGASGLMAARRLAASGFAVTLLEASTVPGGRIHSLSIPGFGGFVEAGAEFVHGDLPITLQLAREAGVALTPTHYSQLSTDSEAGDQPFRWDDLLEAMAKLNEDMPVAQFLDTFFPGAENARLRRSVQGFAEGYDLADLATVSTRALYLEWSGEEDSSSYRVEGGYGRLVDYLVRECARLGVRVHFGSPVSEVRWQEGRVELHTTADQIFTADKLVMTASLGALPGIVFQPSLPEIMRAAAGIGYGSVIKILLEFRAPFWLDRRPPGTTLFVLSRQAVPTWWTQGDDRSALLTGWLTGENMRRFRVLDPKEQLECCLSSVASIFFRDRVLIRDELKTFRIFDWQDVPYVHGGYSFDMVKTPECRRLLQRPVAETLYFAGEAIYGGNAPGTVEAAFHSGLEVAAKIIARS
ncbi:MAG TPA: NAD(P)/FAD-dependent oxidoreductase [Puia sp.]|nr:NAD(P)/FAD-dependent oxidoreductase [Puia sp.]